MKSMKSNPRLTNKFLMIRVALVLLIALTLTYSSLSPTTASPAAAAGCGTTNVALNKPATASSVTGTNTAALAVDANIGSRWESLYSDPQWIQIDLGSTQSICQVKLTWETASGKSY